MPRKISLFLTLIAGLLVACSLLSEAAALPTPTGGIPPSPALPEDGISTIPNQGIPRPTEISPVPNQEIPRPTEISPVPNQEIPRPTEALPEEAILILEPGPGSRVLSPVHIAGFADPTFEQHLLVRIVLDDGTELALEPTIIQADTGERGPFSIDVPFTLEGERQAFIQVSTSSPRDGGTTHLASVIVTLASSGEPDIIPVSPHPERIVILGLAPGDSISGGVANVSGFALASFEQTLVVDVIDEEGNVVGSQPLIVDAPDLGQPGPFSAAVPYTVSAPGPGRIVVRDPSVAFDGDVHLASVEVELFP
jgi:hypothetical protein